MFKLINLFRPTTSAEAQHTASNLLRENLKLKYLQGKANVEQIIQPGKTGRVRFRGSWWPARSVQEMTLFPGETVYVVGRENITLLVERLHSSESTLSECVN